MDSVLFVLEVIAFLVVVGWVCVVESTGSPTRGVLGMREEDVAVPAPLPEETGWRRVPKRVAAGRATVQKPNPPKPAKSTPSWRRPMGYDRRR